MAAGARGGESGARRDLSSALDAHGPPAARGQLGPSRLEELGRAGSTGIEAAVVVGDLRMSTLILREAVQPSLFARFIVGFTEAVRELARTSDGWFDKFTGDGFIAFWIYPQAAAPDLDRLLDFCQTVLPAADTLLLNLRRNSRNFPTGAGLSLGIDAGPCELVRVGGALTVVGSPIVGATRMVECARAKETYVNVQLGERFERALDRLSGTGVRLERTVARTKEYPAGQEAYRLEFLPRPTHGEETRAGGPPDAEPVVGG